MADADKLKDALASQLQTLLDGAEADIEKYAAIMAVDIAEAAAAGDEDLKRTISLQARALAERQRLSASNAGWVAVQHVIEFALALA